MSIKQLKESRKISTRRVALRKGLSVILAGCMIAISAADLRAQRDLRDIPDSDPELERASFEIADGFEVNLFASDPQMAKPIHMNFDDRGRLWIASSEVYPQIEPGQKASDKILVIEDQDRDGVADSTTTFADGLLIPTGVLPTAGGCYVANSTELIRLIDSDLDGKADRKQIVLSGFGTEDTHHLLHTLQWGPDAAMYMNQSIYIHSHIETPYGVQHLNGGGIWRFEPDSLKLSVLCKGFVNPWGHQFDQWGHSFATDGAYREGINYVFPGSVFVTSPNARRIVAGLNPGSPKHCGLEILGGSHLPEDWQGNMVTNDFRAHRVCRFIVTRSDTGYTSRQEEELIKTKHVAFRPIDVKMGPDGAIYVADWYNPIIQHGEVDFRDERRDHVHGRIWRITARGRPLVDRVDFDSLSIEELVAQLGSRERWNRTFAKRRLVAKDPQKVVLAANEWLAGHAVNGRQTERLKLEVLWLQQAIHQVDMKLLNELATASFPSVRASAVRVATHVMDRIEEPLALLKRAINDHDWQVRLEGVRGLAAIRQPQAATLALTVLDRPLNSFLDFALWQTMNDLSEVWLPLAQEGRFDFGGDVERLAFALKSVDSPNIVQPLLRLVEDAELSAENQEDIMQLVVLLGDGAQLAVVFEYVLQVADRDPKLAERLLAGLAAQQQVRKVRPDIERHRLADLFASEDEKLLCTAARTAGIWNAGSLRDKLNGWAIDQNVSGELRLAAIDALASLGGDQTIKLLSEIAEGEGPIQTRSRAISGLAKIDPRPAANLAAVFLSRLQPDDDPTTVVRGFVRQKRGQTLLASAVDNVQIDSNVGKRAIREVQASAKPDLALIEALRAAAGLGDAGWKLTPEVSARLQDKVAERGDPARGEAIYRRAELKCLDCHAIGGSGGDVGPDLVSIGASAQVDYLIESLLDPNTKIKENFHSKTLITLDGQILTGIPIGSSDGFLSLKQGDGEVVRVRSDDIEEMTDGPSLMPDGLLDSLTEDELVDLTRFLSELGKVGAYSLPNRQLARTWQSLVWTELGNSRLNRTSFDMAATDDDALTWKGEFSQVDGTLPIDQLARFQPHQEVEPTSFVRCFIETSKAAEIVLVANGIQGLSLWVDGKPTPVRERLAINLEAGRHQLTYAINRSERNNALKIELEPSPATESTPATFQLRP